MSGTSGTYNFSPSLSELVLDAAERCGVLAVEMTVQNQKIQSARRSANLVLSAWANRGINLWTVQEVVQYMPENIGLYYDDASCIDIIADSIVIRQYQMGAPVDVAPDFSTTSASDIVTVAGLAATPLAGGYLTVGVMVSVGGIVLDGIYQVLSVPGSGQATIQAAASATSTVANSGVVPSYTTTGGSAVVTVDFPNHGLLAGQTFMAEVATAVGGITLSGPYTVNSGPTTNAFTITAPYNAGSGQTVSENGGSTQLATQAVIQGTTQNAFPTDLLLYPLSRGDFMAIPVKSQQGRPTSIWIDRQIVPQMHIWPVPDINGPYELRYRRARQIQDADIVGGLQMQLPFRGLEAFVSALAANLAIKWAPDKAIALAQYASMQWDEFAAEDREKVSSFIVPDMSGYFSV